MSEPRKWTSAELTRDAEEAKALFRQQRLNEPRGLYTQFFDAFAPIFDRMIDQMAGSEPLDPAQIVQFIGDEDIRTAFRYLAAPPVSDDDLKTLADAKLSARALRRDPEVAARVREIMLQVIDPHRFPWVGERRDPTEKERTEAVVASAVLVAARKVETARRSDAKNQQEESVKATLRDIDFAEVSPRDMPLLDAAPAPGEFCGESKLGDTRADLVIRLYDRRAMPVECKASNSAVNSFKRINHEAVGKARAWLAGFGGRQIVPCAVIGGVFNPANLESAQAEGLVLIWSHRLDDLAEFIEATRSTLT